MNYASNYYFVLCQTVLRVKINPLLVQARILQRHEELIKQRKKFEIQIHFATANSAPLGKTLGCSLVKWNLNFKDR